MNDRPHMHSAGDNLRQAGFNPPVSPPRAARWEKTEQAVPIVTQSPEHAVGRPPKTVF
jgi:hypothetical protein